jgi:hypothetical protein
VSFKPRVEFDRPQYEMGLQGFPMYDTSPDGQRFLMMRAEGADAQTVRVVQGFSARTPR